MLAAIIITNLIALSISTIASSRSATEERVIFSSAETTASSIIFTQRESLAYTTKYALWLAGETSKREVQISRALLAQRLNVIDIGNGTMGSRLDPEYLQALKESDQILESAPDGILTRDQARFVSDRANEFISTFLLASRSMVVQYQQELDQHLLDASNVRKSKAEQNLFLLLSLMFLTSIFLLWIGRTALTQFRDTRKYIQSEVEALNSAQKELESTQSVVRTLEKLNESKNDFISTVNHELRTPLTSIIGYVELLKMHLDSQSMEKCGELIEVIDKNALVLLDLVESILSLSKLDAQGLDYEFTEVDLLKVIEKAIFVLTPQSSTSNIVVEVETNRDSDYKALGNTSQLSQVFINLISNAIKFSPKNSRIQVIVSRVQNDLMLSEIEVKIVDQGMGIPEDEIPQLFDRFFRASNAAKNHIAGTGLGLSIANRIVELHKGRISVSSTPNVGSVFTVNLPVFITQVEQLIFDKRAQVLLRAIDGIEQASQQDLQNVCHEMGGAIGFYALEGLSEEIAGFVKWLRDETPKSEAEIQIKRDILLAQLKQTYRIIHSEEKIDAR